MYELFMFLHLVISWPALLTLLVFVLGGCMHAFAIVLYDWGRETINGPKAPDKQLHHHATDH